MGKQTIISASSLLLVCFVNNNKQTYNEEIQHAMSDRREKKKVEKMNGKKGLNTFWLIFPNNYPGNKQYLEKNPDLIYEKPNTNQTSINQQINK